MPLTRTRILTDTKIKQAKPKEKEYKLSDGEGLVLVVKPNGSKLWRRWQPRVCCRGSGARHDC